MYKIGNDIALDDENIKTGVSKVERGRMKLELEGWAYKNGQSIETYQSYFVLKNQENGKMYLLNTKMEQVPELELVDNNYNCLNSGMHCESLVFGIKDGIYEIYVLYQNDNENSLVNTGITVEI